MTRTLFMFCLLLSINFSIGSENSGFCIKSDGVEGEIKECSATNTFSKKKLAIYGFMYQISQDFVIKLI